MHTVDSHASHQRRAVDSDFVAELADFLVGHDEDGFVFAQFGFAGDEHRAVVHVGRPAFVRLRRGKLGVTGEEFEIGLSPSRRL